MMKFEILHATRKEKLKPVQVSLSPLTRGDLVQDASDLLFDLVEVDLCVYVYVWFALEMA